jgi:6-phosphogluconolactonase
MQVKIFKNTIDLSCFFAGLLVEKIRGIDKTDSFTMALSGGTTPRLLFECLSNNYREKIDWGKIKFFWGDERCVGPENDESNYKMARLSLLDKVPVQETNVFRVFGENDHQYEPDRYEAIVKKHVKFCTSIPQFDLMMLGLGEDGHTASIFPDNLKLFETDELFALAQNPYNKQNRITATGKLINHAALLVFIVTGESKAEMVSRVIKQSGDFSSLPASSVKPVNGEVYWLLDQKAASKL